MSENDDVVAAILVLGIDRAGRPGTPAELVRQFDLVRDELLQLRETKSRLQLEAWEQHAVHHPDSPRPT